MCVSNNILLRGVLPLACLVTICSCGSREDVAVAGHDQAWVGQGELQCRAFLDEPAVREAHRALVLQIRNATNYPLAMVVYDGAPLLDLLLSNNPPSVQVFISTKGWPRPSVIIPAQTLSFRLDDYCAVVPEDGKTTGLNRAKRKKLSQVGFEDEVRVRLGLPKGATLGIMLGEAASHPFRIVQEGEEVYVDDKRVWPHRVKFWTGEKLLSNPVRIGADRSDPSTNAVVEQSSTTTPPTPPR